MANKAADPYVDAKMRECGDEVQVDGMLADHGPLRRGDEQDEHHSDDVREGNAPKRLSSPLAFWTLDRPRSRLS